jgi:hypothetical protein
VLFLFSSWGVADEMYAELYEETLRFEEASLQASIRAYEEEEGAAVPMQWCEDDEQPDDEVVPASLDGPGCPGCGRGLLVDVQCALDARPVPGCRCSACPFAVVGAQAATVCVAVRHAAAMHSSGCVRMDLEWRVDGGVNLSCRCRVCGATAAKNFGL